jgi:hypothetical protein
VSVRSLASGFEKMFFRLAVNAAFADGDSVRDLFVPVSGRHKLEYLCLPRCEHILSDVLVVSHSGCLKQNGVSLFFSKGL